MFETLNDLKIKKMIKNATSLKVSNLISFRILPSCNFPVFGDLKHFSWNFDHAHSIIFWDSEERKNIFDLMYLAMTGQ